MTRSSVALGLGGLLLLSACASEEQTSAPSAPFFALERHPAPQSRSEGFYRPGSPYQIKGVWYYPQADWNYDQTGTASWYGEQFQHRLTANGEVFELNDLSAAHKTLPLPAIVEVTNLDNGRSLRLRVNDRGPFFGDRIIDVSRRAAQLLGFEGPGTAHVRVRLLRSETEMAQALARQSIIGDTMYAAGGTAASREVAAAPPAAEPAPAPMVVAAAAPPPAPAAPPSAAPASPEPTSLGPVATAAASPASTEPTVAAAPAPAIDKPAMVAAAQPSVPATAAPTAQQRDQLGSLLASLFAPPAQAEPLAQPPAAPPKLVAAAVPETPPLSAPSPAAAESAPTVAAATPEPKPTAAPEPLPESELADAAPTPEPVSQPAPVHLHFSSGVSSPPLPELPPRVLLAGGPPRPELPPAKLRLANFTVPFAQAPAKPLAKPEPAGLYVQAGTFSHEDNAMRVRAKLTGLGTVRVTDAMVNGVPLYRVRIGPVGSPAEADRVLHRVVDSGISGAHIVNN